MLNIVLALAYFFALARIKTVIFVFQFTNLLYSRQRVTSILQNICKSYHLQTAIRRALFLRKSARKLQGLVFVIRPQSSPCMYHFLVQKLVGSGEPRGNNFVLLRGTIAKPDESEMSPFSYVFGTARFFQKFFNVSKGSRFNCLDTLQQTGVSSKFFLQ